MFDLFYPWTKFGSNKIYINMHYHHSVKITFEHKNSVEDIWQMNQKGLSQNSSYIKI